MIKILLLYIIKQVIKNNRFDINNVITIFLFLSTGMNYTLYISLLFLYCSVLCTLITKKAHEPGFSVFRTWAKMTSLS